MKFPKFPGVICLVLLVFVGFMPASGKTPSRQGTPSAEVEDNFNLAEFGAVGDGIADDGPALQNALNAIAAAGGGTLFVPAGRYAINTPVQKDFTGLGASLTVFGVESSTPVPPPNAPGAVLTRGLDLTSEFAPRTGTQGVAIKITGLQSFLIKDIAFIGQPDVFTDAVVTLALFGIPDATIRHCEFYGLSTLVGGSIVLAVRSQLNIEQSVFLGTTANSGLNSPVVENIEWKGVTIVDAVFADYGQRAGFYGKLGLAPPYSWVNIGNAAAPESNSPRREATIKNVFLDEGGFFGISSTPYRYLPASAPIDLIYISGLYMNVTNLAADGNYLYGPQRALIVNSHYGWSHNADAAIYFLATGNAILDQVECVDGANRIRADAATQKLTVINSTYTFLNSLSPQTKVITTASPEDDPVQYVSQRFNATLGRDPDAAAHFYWSDRLLQCGVAADCLATERAALEAYLGAAPAPTFSIAGRVTDETGAGFPHVTLTLSGSQSVTTQTGADGSYSFDKLPTSGVYTVTASRPDTTINTPPQTITTPNGNRTLNFTATLTRHTITIFINDNAGQAIAGVNVLLSSQTEQTGTTDSSGRLVFAAQPGGESYTIVPTKDFYSFTPESVVIGVLQADQTLTFSGTLATSYRLSGQLTANGQALSGATVVLSGSQSRSRTTDANGNYSFNVVPGGSYTVTPMKTNYLVSPTGKTFNNVSGNQVANFEATLQSTPEFSAASYNVSEGAGTIAVNVRRTGDTSSAAEFVYSATDGSATQRADVIPLIGKLSFAAGETSKSFNVFINDDSYIEGNENLTLELRKPVGANLSNNTATLTIVDNDSNAGAANPIDGADFFVRQQYRDFLNRPADAEGLAFWSNQITSCGTNAVCIADRRIDVSGAFFLSIEFQETGYLVYRLYRASFGQPPRHLDEFLLDTRTIGEGVVVNAPGWQELLEGNRRRFIEDFVKRPQFSLEYPYDLTPVAFVNQLNAKAGAPLDVNGVSAAVAEFAGAATSEDSNARALVLRMVAESQTFTQRQLNSAFVLMQYFGYMQRNPDDAPDNNLDGYNFWSRKLEEFGGDFRRAEMVKSFLVSTEYRARFGAP